MSETTEQIEQTPITDPSTTDEIRNKGGRPKGSSKPKIDWYARREAIWKKMNAAIDSGSPAPAVIRALQSQLDTCNQAIANEADERRERQRVKELQKELQETVPAPVPPVPAPADLVVEQRVNKLLKELEEEERLKKTSAPAALSDEEKSRRAEAVERDRKTKEETAKRAEEKAVAEELEKKEA